MHHLNCDKHSKSSRLRKKRKTICFKYQSFGQTTNAFYSKDIEMMFLHSLSWRQQTKWYAIGLSNVLHHDGIYNHPMQ